MRKLSNNRKGLIFIIGLLLIFFVFDKTESLFYRSQNKKNHNIEYSATTKGTKGGAYVAAKQFIKQKLKAPSTAEFESVTQSKITDLGNGVYYVHIKVDVQNDYGVMLQKTFSVEVECTGKDQWMCNEIQEY